MASLLAYTESIAKKLGKEDDYGTKEIIKFDILAAFATLIKREYDKTGIYNMSLVKTLKCVPLIKVDVNHCGEEVIEGMVLRSKNKLPKPLIVKDGTLFISITTPIIGAKRRTITVIAPEEVEDIKYKRFTSKQVYATSENDYLYIYGNVALPSVSVRLLPDNPFDVDEFLSTNANEKECACECGDCENCEEDENCEEEEEDNCFSDSNDTDIPFSYMAGITSLMREANSLYTTLDETEIKINE